jgi:hypothetical protein
MPLLSNLFGNSGDSESSNSSDFFSDLDAVLSVDYSSESYHQEVDDDGSSETSYDSTSFGTDLDLGSVIASMTDSMSESDGLFG